MTMNIHDVLGGIDQMNLHRIEAQERAERAEKRVHQLEIECSRLREELRRIIAYRPRIALRVFHPWGEV